MSRHIDQYAKIMQQIVEQAEGWISHADATLRLKEKMFPPAARTAGVVGLADEALTYLARQGRIELRQEGPVRVYRRKV
jgi:hypothetical protein